MNNNNNRPRDPRQNNSFPPQNGQAARNSQYQNGYQNRQSGGVQNNQNRQSPSHNGTRPQYNRRLQNGQQYRGQGQNNPYPPVRHRSRKQAQRAVLTLALTAVILVLLLVSVIIFAARCAINIADGGKDSDIVASDLTVTDNGIVTSPPETEPPVETEPPLDPAYEYLTLTEADIHKGYQILINYDHPYNFSGDFEFKTLYSAKNGLYKVSNTTDSLDSEALTWFVSMMAALVRETGNNDIIVTSADRSFEFQEQLYMERVDMYGEEFAQLYVAKPGHSEHHTGLALDLAIYTDGGKAFTFDDKPEYPDWLRANAHKYGFIERYTADKTAITKIAYENWHYRYIGKPHAYYIKTNNLCLEEYIDTLRMYSFNEPHLIFADDDGISWELYYIAAHESGTTRVPVPKDGIYELSGNNADGYIVTVQK